MKLKAFFNTFKGLSIAKNCLRPESALLIYETKAPYSQALWLNIDLEQAVFFHY